jgi:hypothetical protein
MNTVSQKVVEISTAHVPASGSEVSVSTSKVFVKRFNHNEFGQWADMVQWCIDTLNAEQHDTTWWISYPSFYFRDEREYTLFLLRWS